jgi:DNA-3-methyladenine glycosylase II
MDAYEDKLMRAGRHLAATDPVLAAIIAAAGPCTLRPHTNYYQELVQSILGQQLSLQAAAAIEARFVALFEGIFPSPEQILSKDPEDFRAVGFSRTKAAYVQDLARHVLDGDVSFDGIDTLSNEEIIAQLTAVKGVGVWTVHMFLIFSLGRLDVLPVGDLGIKNGIRKLYSFDIQPTADDVQAISDTNGWHPYESVASWYVWQSLKLPSIDS